MRSGSERNEKLATSLSLASIYSKLHDHDTKKQSDYVVDQLSFPLIALFWLNIGRCHAFMETRL